MRSVYWWLWSYSAVLKHVLCLVCLLFFMLIGCCRRCVTTSNIDSWSDHISQISTEYGASRFTRMESLGVCIPSAFGVVWFVRLHYNITIVDSFNLDLMYNIICNNYVYILLLFSYDYEKSGLYLCFKCVKK